MVSSSELPYALPNAPSHSIIQGRRAVRNPTFRVKVRAVTAAEVATSTAHADHAARVLIQTAAHTDLRIGELAGLELNCVNLEKGEIHVEK
jgi:integrase